jgi:phage terminase small subunit
MRQLEARRVLTPGDGPLLEQFSVLRCRWAEARAYVSAHGAVEEIPILDRQGVTVGYRTEFPKQFQIAQDSEKQLLALTRVLGLTPIDKDKTRPAKLSADEAPVDEAEEFLLSKPEIEATQDPARLN